MVGIHRKLESETLHLPELKPLVGRTVEITVTVEPAEIGELFYPEAARLGTICVILVDTSVVVDYTRGKDVKLQALIPALTVIHVRDCPRGSALRRAESDTSRETP